MSADCKSQICTLNVGGQLFTTLAETLRRDPESILAKLNQQGACPLDAQVVLPMPFIHRQFDGLHNGTQGAYPFTAYASVEGMPWGRRATYSSTETPNTLA